MILRTQAGVWTQPRWWDTFSVSDALVLLRKGDETLTVAVLPTEEAAQGLFRVLGKRTRFKAASFDVARWLEDEAAPAAGGAR